MNIQELDTEEFRNLMNPIIKSGLNSHRFDGLDCSGYITWLYNQITDKYTYDSDAWGFVNQSGMITVDSSNILPGDTYGWSSHIVMVVGPYAVDSKAYVLIESTIRGTPCL